MDGHYGKESIDGVGATIKKQVFNEIKSSRLSILTSHYITEGAQNLVVSIISIYLRNNEVLYDPRI